MELISHRLNFQGRFGDKRLADRARLVSHSLLSSRVSSIRAATGEESAQRGFYRFVNNEKVTEKELVAAHQESCSGLCKGRNLLVIQDSSEVDLSQHANRLRADSGQGPVGNHLGTGFLLHGCLAIDMDSCTLIGVPSLQLWHRQASVGSKEERRKRYRSLAIGDKESGKWIRGAEQSKACLGEAASIVFVEDREGDIYEQFARVPDGRTHLVIRSRDNRTVNGNQKLHAVLGGAPLAGTFELDITGDLRKHTVTRKAAMEIRYAPVAIQRPATLKKDTSLPPSINLYAVEARETAAAKGKPVVWRILTTLPVNSYAEAMGIIGRYKQRWFIEQMFRLLKKKGFRIEDSELETAWAIRKLTILAINAILRVMQMMMAYGNENGQPVAEVYTQKERECLALLNRKLETKTIKNPCKNNTLAWATWIIARVGGWKGRPSQGKPGPLVLKNGLDRFSLIYQGWAMAMAP
jgi:hypothetical protein